MRSPSRAIVWEFWTRHRVGFSIVGVYLVALGVLKAIVLASGRQVIFSSPEAFAFTSIIPVTATFVYFIAVFSHGLSGDLAARQSIYPPRLFTLPVTTEQLVRWPMALGVVAMVLLWTATRLLVTWPSDLHVPLVWPALTAVALLTWTQALCWLPYPLPGLRVAAGVVVLVAFDTTLLAALNLHAGELTMFALLLPQAPLAYVVARYALRRARCGDTPDWAVTVWSLARVRSAAAAPFHSAAAAQTWFEWRQHGMALPTLVAIVVPCELVLLWTATNAKPVVFGILFVVAVTPPVLANFTAVTMRRSSSVENGYGLSPFIATRPLSTASLAAAKLRATALSTAVAWLIVILAASVALALSHTAGIVIGEWRETARIIGAARAAVFELLLVFLCVGATWGLLVQSLEIGLTGREWLVKGSLIVVLAGLVFVGPVLVWIAGNAGVQAWLWHAALWIPAALAVAKLGASSWVAARLVHEHTLNERAVLAAAAWWLLSVAALATAMIWMLWTPFIPRYQLIVIAVLMVPFARVASTPLALAWNRHR